MIKYFKQGNSVQMYTLHEDADVDAFAKGIGGEEVDVSAYNQYLAKVDDNKNAMADARKDRFVTLAKFVVKKIEKLIALDIISKDDVEDQIATMNLPAGVLIELKKYTA